MTTGTFGRRSLLSGSGLLALGAALPAAAQPADAVRIGVVNDTTSACIG